MTRQSIAGRGRSHVFTGLADHRLVVRTKPAMEEPRESDQHGRHQHGARGRERAELGEADLARGEVAGPEKNEARRAREAPEMDRPCRDGADRAERQNGRLTSSSSWLPSSFSPSCHPLPHPRVPRLDRSCGDCTGRVRGVSSGKYILRCLVSPGPLDLGTRAIARSALRRARSLRASRMACDARDGERIPG